MADDLAFLFTDPGRELPSRTRQTDRTYATRPVPHAADRLPADIEWATLRQAHDRTSIPVSTLRKWAKKGKVRARLVRSDGKDLRLVAFGDVVDRARTLDRAIAPVEVVIDLREPPAGGATTRETAPADSRFEPNESRIEPVATVESASAAPADVPGEALAVPDEDPEVPAEAPDAREEKAGDGSILVPLDAWDKMLAQLGNLHEAGQQLAEARERAAKAETEAEFLKERLRDMRARVEETELALELQTKARLIPEVAPAPEPVLRIGWKRFRDRWLGS